MEMQLSMVVLEVRDLAASIAFYRLLGLDVPEPRAGRPVTIHRMGSGVSLVLTESFAARYDPTWTRPAGGYQQLLEFYVGDDDAVDVQWNELVSGFCGRMAPTKTTGPYAAMIDDPDGNVVLLTSDSDARVDANSDPTTPGRATADQYPCRGS